MATSALLHTHTLARAPLVCASLSVSHRIALPLVAAVGRSIWFSSHQQQHPGWSNSHCERQRSTRGALRDRAANHFALSFSRGLLLITRKCVDRVHTHRAAAANKHHAANNINIYLEILARDCCDAHTLSRCLTPHTTGCLVWYVARFAHSRIYVRMPTPNILAEHIYSMPIRVYPAKPRKRMNQHTLPRCEQLRRWLRLFGGQSRNVAHK